MVVGIVVWIVAIVLILVLIVVTVIMIRKGNPEEEYKDYTIVHNYMGEILGQHFEGDLKKHTTGLTRHTFVLKPITVNLMRRFQESKVVEIPDEIVHFYSYQKIDWPRGTLDPETNIIWLFPPKAEYFPEAMKNTAFGQYWMEQISNKKAMKTVVDAIRSERDFEDELISEIKGKKLNREFIKNQRNLYADFVKSELENSKTKQNSSGGSGGYYPPGGNESRY